MKKLLILFLLGIMGQAQAITYNYSNQGAAAGSFDYGGLSWTTNFNNDMPFSASNNGSIVTEVSSTSVVNPVTIMGSDDPVDLFGDCFFLLCTDMLSEMTATSGLDGYLGFDWIFESFDTGGFDQDLFQLTHYDASATTTTLTTLTGSDGFHELLIGVGDMLSLAIYTEFNFDGAASVVISNLGVSADSRLSPVPLPPAFALFGIALAGLGFVRRRKDSLVGAI